MLHDPYDVLLVVAAAGFGIGSLLIGWSVLRDHARSDPARDGRAANGEATRPHVGLELLAWAVPTILMVALFVAAIRSDR